MDLEAYGNIQWTNKARKAAHSELGRGVRDRRSTTFYKVLEALDGLKALVSLDIDGESFNFKGAGIYGAAILRKDGEWDLNS